MFVLYCITLPLGQFKSGLFGCKRGFPDKKIRISLILILVLHTYCQVKS